MGDGKSLNGPILTCPLCSRPDKQGSWGSVVMNASVERSVIESDITKAKSLGELADRVNGAISMASKSMHWCSCGRVIWVQGYGWLLTLDFIINIAKAIQQRLPAAYESVLRELRTFMPDEFARVVKVVGGEGASP